MNSKSSRQKYDTGVKPTWCLGCGDFVIRAALISALSELKLAPYRVVITYDIGCMSNGADKINTYGFKSLHGRAIPPAVGVKHANPNITVISVLGDGAAYGEGIAHLVSAAQSDVDIAVIVANNQIYGLTAGQSSPTTKKGVKTKSYPYGTPNDPIDPLHIAKSAGASFVARGYSGNLKELTQLIKKAITHKGFALVDVLQDCATWRKEDCEQVRKSIENNDIKTGVLSNGL